MAEWLAAQPADVLIVVGILLSAIVGCGIVGWYHRPEQPDEWMKRGRIQQ